jgi:hypothetical protein
MLKKIEAVLTTEAFSIALLRPVNFSAISPEAQTNPAPPLEMSHQA